MWASMKFLPALWADSVFPRMNTIASRDQFKPIRTGENLVVNYKG